ncbi:MAG TPA: hypothetical protein PKN33_10120 [Phycisphaerae bacterium]|nr:hypothetical protein [Phycisphaerae bacterium]
MSQQEELYVKKNRRTKWLCMAAFFALPITCIGAVRLWEEGGKSLDRWIDSWFPGPGRADYSFNLTEDYEFVRFASHSRAICRETDRDLGLGTVIVGDDVTQLGWNDQYIVCFQEPSEQYNRSTGWWIVDTQSHSRNGPMNLEDYEAMLGQLGINGTIQVHPVESYGRDGVLEGQ